MWYFVLLLILNVSSRAFGIISPGAARSQGLGSAGAMLADDASVMPNQAALAILKKAGFSFHAENSFLMPELALGTFSLCMPSKSGTFGFAFSKYGYWAYQESRTSLAFGKAFGDKFRAGIEMCYWRIRQHAGYGNLHAFIPALGLQVLPTRTLVLGFHISNPAGQCFSPGHSRKIPVVFRAGLGYYAGDDILICFEYSKETNFKPVYCGGIEYNCGKLVIFRMGLSSSVRLQYSFGLGIRSDHLKTDVAVSHHPVLGYSPAITLTYSL